MIIHIFPSTHNTVLYGELEVDVTHWPLGHYRYESRHEG